jgi:hypothetical protein
MATMLFLSQFAFSLPHAESDVCKSLIMVGAKGFEPSTPCTPCRCATRLRYAPTGRQGASKTTARPDRFRVLARPSPYVHVLSRDSLRAFARSGLLATFLKRLANYTRRNYAAGPSNCRISSSSCRSAEGDIGVGGTIDVANVGVVRAAARGSDVSVSRR